MISGKEAKYIESRAFSYTHEYLYYSEMFGEPFLVEGFLCYSNGEILFIDGYNLENKKLTIEAIKSIISKNPSFEKADFILCIGPEKIDGEKLPPEFGFTGVSEPDELNVDMIIDLKNFDLEKLEHAKKDLKYALRRGYRVEVNKHGVFSTSHTDLIKQFKHKISPYSALYILALKSYVKSSHVILYDVYSGNRLVGFTAASYIFKERPIHLLAFFDNSAKGASDITYYGSVEMLNESPQESYCLSTIALVTKGIMET